MGYPISKEDISPDLPLIDKRLKVDVLKNKKELKSFFRLLNFYSRLLQRYYELAEPFVALRKKNVDYIWTKDQQVAFEDFKTGLVKKAAVKNI